MKPIFTIHAGEYLVAAEIEKSFKDIIVWIPSKDIGIDLLLTDKQNKKTISLQVKFSKDFNVTHTKEHLRPNIKGTGWWTLTRTKIAKSNADYWVFILYSMERKSNDFIIIQPRELLKIFDNLEKKMSVIHCYITVTNKNKSFETRGMSKGDMQLLYENRFICPKRDLTKYLNNWIPIVNALK